MSRDRTLLTLFGLPRGPAIVALVFSLAALTVFFLIDDFLFYLLVERIFAVKLGALAKSMIGLVFVLLNLGIAILVVRAMLRRPAIGHEAMVGAQAEVIESIHPAHPGWVRIRGELWRAAAVDTIRKGDYAEIVAVDGLLLRVKSAGKTG